MGRITIRKAHFGILKHKQKLAAKVIERTITTREAPVCRVDQASGKPKSM